MSTGSMKSDPVLINGTPHANRRAFGRREGKGIARCRPGKWGTGKEITGKLADISPDGAGILFPTDAFKVGDKFEVELTSHTSRQGFKTFATVCMAKTKDQGFIVGCKFEKRISYQQLAEISR